VNFSVLFVCTGNICRSPAAELLFTARLAALPVPVPITVASAGTSGLSGHDMDAPSAYAVRELGIDPSVHVARRVNPAMVNDADLILTADSEHRSTILRAQPLVFRRTFTMREFARLGAGLAPLPADVTVQALHARVAEIADQRGIVEPGLPGSDDIGDPLGGGLDVARATVARIDQACAAALAALGLPSVGSPSVTPVRGTAG
jgi:protein-tyrosine phosphatase